jgi:hypothetical protein
MFCVNFRINVNKYKQFVKKTPFKIANDIWEGNCCVSVCLLRCVSHCAGLIRARLACLQNVFMDVQGDPVTRHNSSCTYMTDQNPNLYLLPACSRRSLLPDGLT